MVVTELTQGELVMPGAVDRPPGLHLSDIIKDLMVSLAPKSYGRPGGPDVVKIQSGLAFEEALERMFEPASPGAWRPAPIQVDGVWCSPDSVDPDCTPGHLVVREFKLTWYSMKKPCPYDDVFWPWLVQIKGYCRAVGTNLAVLTVLFINGDYSPPKPHPPKGYGLQFTDLEIQENWNLVVNHAKSKGWL